MALTRVAVACLSEDTHWGQQWTPALTRPHVRLGLSVRLREVCCTRSLPSLAPRVASMQAQRVGPLGLASYPPLLATKAVTECHIVGRRRGMDDKAGCIALAKEGRHAALGFEQNGVTPHGDRRRAGRDGADPGVWWRRRRGGHHQGRSLRHCYLNPHSAGADR